ncbi:hypothetical protein B0H14DRAFT_2578371 [Mycena olivaceomarginata]|nr:hypothetical protein B0H14DRAFT_2578371 [Mycena olivaceomarginata]
MGTSTSPRLNRRTNQARRASPAVANVPNYSPFGDSASTPESRTPANVARDAESGPDAKVEDVALDFGLGAPARLGFDLFGSAISAALAPGWCPKRQGGQSRGRKKGGGKKGGEDGRQGGSGHGRGAFMDRCDAQCAERAAIGEGESEGVHRKNRERGALMARMQYMNAFGRREGGNAMRKRGGNEGVKVEAQKRDKMARYGRWQMEMCVRYAT